MPKPTTEAWFKRLEGDRLEIFFKTADHPGKPDLKIRASGMPQAMNELADWFEAQVGMKINAPWRVKPVKEIPGQTSLSFTELDMGDATGIVGDDSES